MPTTYKLNVDIGGNQIAPLAGYSLCISRQVQLANGTVVNNVVWQGSDIFPNNAFQWEEQFQVFGSSPWVVGAEVSATTNAQDIDFGQNCIIQGNLMQPATGDPDTSGKFSVTNQNGEGINVGINCNFQGQQYAIFVTPTDLLSGGTGTFEPLEVVVVGFDQNAKTGSMIENMDGPSIVVPYDGATVKTIAYTGPNAGGGAWSIIN